MKKYNLIFLISLVISLVSCIREDNTPVKIPPITGAVVNPDVGGPTQPNQVWINLTDNTSKINKRDAWDLGFYSGEEFRVILNSSIMMAAGKIENTTDIDAVTPAMVADLKTKVQVANFSDNTQYIDDPAGNYLTQTTGIAEISKVDSENAVYLLNMGKKPYEGNVTAGSAPTSGDARGWKKIRILRHNNGYKIQFANLEDTTHQEMIIEKKPTHHFSFLNIENKALVDIQPEKKNWDLCFTVFTNVVNVGAYNSSYIFADMVLLNSLAGVVAYRVDTAKGEAETIYNAFTKADIDEAKFEKNDQRTIGASWRDVFNSQAYSDRFYIVKNADGFYFKIRFLKMSDEKKYRGYPEFEYKPL